MQVFLAIVGDVCLPRVGNDLSSILVSSHTASMGVFGGVGSNSESGSAPTLSFPSQHMTMEEQTWTVPRDWE
jgi:hypothetical protein